MRVFGAGFKDPNAASFTPDPAVVVRRSVLSAVNEQTRSFERQLGAADKAHLDQYLTSLRGLEQQLDLQLQKPAPLAACSLPLDRMLVLNYTDSGFAKNHTTDNVPILTAGSAGRRVKTGFHFAAPKGDPVTRVSLTVLQALGVPISTFGSESNRTAKTITEVMV
jgi:hypothetical protein